MSTGAQTPKIIVSYRRTDSAMAGRIFDRLVQRFGKKSLFIDIDNIPFGGDFRRHIDDALKSSDILIALVGPRWAGGEGKDAKITREADPVRVEIETALKQNIQVLPVLLDEARMPEPSELPESIREFAYRNAAEVESGRDFDIHVDRLIKAVEQILGAKASPQAPAEKSDVSPPPASEPATLVSPPPKPKSARRLWPIALGAAAILLAALGAWLARDRLLTAEEIDPTTGTAYCTDFKQAITEARNDFTAIMGRKTSPEIWTARLQLPGWDNCIVSDWTNQEKILRYYGCELPSVATADEMQAKRKTSVAYLKSCLGKEWVMRRIGNETNFESAINDPIGRIRETSYTDGRGNILRIEVDVPASLIRPAAEAVSEQPAPTPSPPQPSDQTGAYCEDLKRVVGEARSNFASILGPESSGTWSARIQLPGWDDCTVRDWAYEGKTTRYFSCQLPAFSTLEAVHAKRDEAAAYVKPCLGPDWTERRAQFSDQTTDVTYFQTQSDPIVRLRESYYKDSKEWFLRIDVDAPASLTTPAPAETTDQPTTPQSETPSDQPLTAPSPPETAPEAPPIAPPSAY